MTEQAHGWIIKVDFKTCAEINQWAQEEKSLNLSVSFRGQTQGVFGNLSKKSNNYEEI